MHLASEIWRVSYVSAQAPINVGIIFPSRRELAPAVRAFADYMKEVSQPGVLWLDDPLAIAAYDGRNLSL